MEYKGSPMLLAHLVSLGTLLISVYTLRSMGVDEFFLFFFFLHLNVNGILFGSSDLVVM